MYTKISHTYLGDKISEWAQDSFTLGPLVIGEAGCDYDNGCQYYT